LFAGAEKELKLLDQFENLKSKNQLDKYMQTKLIKNEKKIKRFTPYSKNHSRNQE
jgi:hypothetical protein